jgi:hypothetical protein
VTGVFTRGHFGLMGAIWGEWKLTALDEGNKTWFGLKVEAEAAYTRWSKPSTTNTFAWAGWGALAVHFGDETFGQVF